MAQFYANTLAFTPKDKGMAIGNLENVKKAHNSFARQDPFDVEVTKTATADDDVFHFVSYLPFKNQLYELDGLQPGPIAYGEVTEENWL